MNKQKLYSLLHQAYELEFSGNYKQADILDNMIRTSAGVSFLESMLKDIATSGGRAYSSVLSRAGLVAEDVKLLESLPEAEKALITTPTKAIEKIRELKAIETTRTLESVEEASKFRETIDKLRGTAKGVGERVKGVGQRVKSRIKIRSFGALLQGFREKISNVKKFTDQMNSFIETFAKEGEFFLSTGDRTKIAEALGKNPNKNRIYRTLMELRDQLGDLHLTIRAGIEDSEGLKRSLTDAEKLKLIDEVKKELKGKFTEEFIEGACRDGFTNEQFVRGFIPYRQYNRGTKVLFGLIVAGALGTGVAVGTGAIGGKPQLLDADTSGGGSSTAPPPASDAADVQPAAAEGTSQPSQQSLLTERQRQRQDASKAAFDALKPLITSTPQRLGPTTPLGQIYVFLKDEVSEQAANSAILKLRAENEKNNWGLDYSSRDSEIGKKGFEFIRSI